MINNKKCILILMVCLLALAGCQKFNVIKIQQQNNQLLFDLSKMGQNIDGNRQYILYDIAVSRENCSSDNCVVWESVREPAYFDSLKQPLTKSTIQYGSKLAAMKTTVTPKTLTSGDYSIAASVGLLVNEKFNQSFKIFQNFKLTVSQNGELSIRSTE